VTKYAHIFSLILNPKSISLNFFPKSKKGNEKWTFLKMSKNENPKIVLKKGSFSEASDHNALIFVFWGEKSVTIKFLRKKTAIFFVS
jgi:hypothetical protein